jgi:hypothetical protein
MTTQRNIQFDWNRNGDYADANDSQADCVVSRCRQY